MLQSQVVKDDLQRRLRRVEGQVRGVQRMLDEERECQEVIQQLSAIQAAVRNATKEYLRAYATDCLLRPEETGGKRPEAVVDELVELMARMK